MNLHIITGGTKGLGAALAKNLASRGDRVVVLARSKGEELERVSYIQVDLCQINEIGPALQSLFQSVKNEEYDCMTLVNNAGMIEPIAQSHRLDQEQTLKASNLNLVAPMVLVSHFLQQTLASKAKKLILNISSGVAKNPLVGWAVYSATKAGLENYTQNLANEYSDNPNVRIVSVSPGIIDTEMQGKIRQSNAEEFPQIQRFKDFKADGHLNSPEVVAEGLSKILSENAFPQETFLTINDLL